MSTNQPLREADVILKNLCKNNGDIQGGAIISNDGRLLTHTFAEQKISARVAIIAGVLVSLCKHSHDTIHIGDFKEFHLQGKARSAVVYGFDNALLLLVIKNGANIGLISLEGSQAARAIAQHFIDRSRN
ncbi:MAG: hypothetical protein H6696_03720 [Deferribacteres bacterium]|nr:hypothetical protein [candidate division KSB1 bacterium]MCB9501020.1 hypothetical protein [Deferribacteres bacterium]